MTSTGYWLRLATPFATIVAAVAAIASFLDDPELLAVVAGVALAATMLASAIQARRVTTLVQEVGAFADLVSAGEYGARVAPPGIPEIDALADSVNAMAARLAREGHARASFIGKVSHELRTPLTVIKGYVYTLRRGEDDAEKAAKLDVINGECERLAYLVEDLLELSRAQAGELRITADTFPLRDCVEEVAERLQGMAAQRSVSIALDWRGNGSLVMGDENRMRQVFANLLTNGIKYAPPGTEVRVDGDTTGDHLAVSVSDAGRGIAPEALPRIFDEFYQAPDGSLPGAGLGLAVVRELVEAHGGDLQVESEVGNGTRFTVLLPAWEQTT
ncbi:MAG TPA: HAMP domain-containing sensor histidine kinase [Gaiellales bacterium]|jgi:signal transduction histidine kinase